MSLSALLTAVVEYAADVIVNDLGRPEPDRILRYHGNLPHDCCTDAGFLTVQWVSEYPSATFPNPSASSASPCEGTPAVELRVRYVVCWPEPETTASGVVVSDAYDTRVDALTAVLADVADGVFRAFLRLSCPGTAAFDPAAADVLAAAARVRAVDATPITPSGMCAGVQWRLYAAPSAGVSAS